MQPTSGPSNFDTVRALCHDLRQPLEAILLLAGADDDDVQLRMDGILDQARRLSDMVEATIGAAADDRPVTVDLAEMTFRCVQRAQQTATCRIGFFGADQALTVAAPIALSRAILCVLDNAVRAAGPDGHVTVDVSGKESEVALRVIDDGPRAGHQPANQSLGSTITRALVSASGGRFDIKPAVESGLVARIVLPAISPEVGS